MYVDSLLLRMWNIELYSLNRLCIVTSFQRVQYWTWEREGRESLQWRNLRWWRSTSTVIKSSWSVSIPTQSDENGVLPPWSSCVPEAHNPNIILRNHQINSNWGIFYKMSDKYSSKLSRSSKTGRVTAKKSLRDTMSKCNMVSWVGFYAEKKDVRQTLSKYQ